MKGEREEDEEGMKREKRTRVCWCAAGKVGRRKREGAGEMRRRGWRGQLALLGGLARKIAKTHLAGQSRLP